MGKPLGWLGIFRLGLIQAALGSIVVLTTSTLNRVMVVELALPAVLPGFLIALHYAIQILRPRWGYGSDRNGSRTPFIIGGMAILALGGAGAAYSVKLMAADPTLGIAVAIVAFIVIGIGVGCSGTALLVLLATSVEPHRRAAAATVTWIMMIVGFIVTTIIAGHYLDPFSVDRLVDVSSVVGLAAFSLTVIAVWNVERKAARFDDGATQPTPPFRQALREVLAEPDARKMAIFIFVSMLAYSAQDLILEPFAGAVFGLTPGESTQLSGLQNGGVLLGMVAVAILGTMFNGTLVGSMRTWRLAACVWSAAALLALGAIGIAGLGWALQPAVFVLGLANGAFAVAAIGSMMVMISHGTAGREGTRMGIWGAAQAIAFGASGLLATSAVDITGILVGTAETAYALVFAAQAVLFFVAAWLAGGLGDEPATRTRKHALAAAAQL